MRFAAYTGLRASELAGLRVRDLNLEEGWVVVGTTLAEVRGHGLLEGPTKTARQRSVPLPRFLVEALRAHAAGKEPTDWVFLGVHRTGGRVPPAPQLLGLGPSLPSGHQASGPGRGAFPRPEAHLRSPPDGGRRPPESGHGAAGAQLDHGHARPLRAPVPSPRRVADG